MSSDAEGEDTIKAQTAVPSPEGSVETADDDEDLVDYNGEEEGGAATPSPAHDVDQANDGKKAPEQASTQSNLEEQDSGGDQTIEKEKIANVAYLACNMLGTDRDLAKPATEWGYTQLAAVMLEAQASFSGLADYNDEDGIKSFFKHDKFDCNGIASDYIISRGLLDKPYAADLLSGNLSTGVKYCNWNQESQIRGEGFFALDTVIPLPKGVAEKFVLISAPELESL